MATDNEYLQQQLINQDPYSLLDSESVYRNREALGATTPYLDDTLGNFPSSAGQLGADVANMAMNPVDTIGAIGNLGLGLIALAIPDAYQEESLDKPQEAAMAVGKYAVDRLGSIEAVKETMRTDPVGFIADISAILLGGGYLATRGGSRIGPVLTQAGVATDPLIVAGKGVVDAGKGIAGLRNVSSNTRPIFVDNFDDVMAKELSVVEEHFGGRKTDIFDEDTGTIQNFPENLKIENADPGSIVNHQPTLPDGREINQGLQTYTVDSVPVAKSSAEGGYIGYYKSKPTSAKDIVRTMDDSMTPTEKMNAMLKERMGDAEPSAPRAEPTKTEQRIADLETQQYDVDNVINREGSNMSDVNLAKLKERKKNITDELDELKKTFENTEVETPPTTITRRDALKGMGATGIAAFMGTGADIADVATTTTKTAKAVKSFSPAPFLEKTKAMFDDMDFLSQYRKDKFDLDNTVKNAPSEVRVNMPKIKKIDDGKFEYDLDLEGTSWLDEDPYYMEKVAHQIELDHFKGSGFAPNELQVLDNLDGALYYTKNLDDYKSITPDKADPGSLKTYTPNMDNKEFAYTVDTYTVDGVPVTRQRLPGNSQQAEFIEYTVPGRKALSKLTK